MHQYLLNFVHDFLHFWLIDLNTGEHTNAYSIYVRWNDHTFAGAKWMSHWNICQRNFSLMSVCSFVWGGCICTRLVPVCLCAWLCCFLQMQIWVPSSVLWLCWMRMADIWASGSTCQTQPLEFLLERTQILSIQCFDWWSSIPGAVFGFSIRAV